MCFCHSYHLSTPTPPISLELSSLHINIDSLPTPLLRKKTMTNLSLLFTNKFCKSFSAVFAIQTASSLLPAQHTNTLRHKHSTPIQIAVSESLKHATKHTHSSTHTHTYAHGLLKQVTLYKQTLKRDTSLSCRQMEHSQKSGGLWRVLQPL